MIYLVGENVFGLNSGTEFAQFQRLHALKAAGLPVKIVTRNYNRFIGKNLRDHGLALADSINMYDFFQGTTDCPRVEQNLRYLKSIPLADYHIVGIDNNVSEIRYHGKTIAKINVMPATVGLVGDIEYYDDLGHVAVREFWDWRGFKSLVETYHPDGTVASQQFLRRDGKLAIEVTHMYINHQVRPTMWRLVSYHGHDHVFDSENDLFTFFLNELNRQTRSSFVCDRRSLDACVLGVDHPRQTVAVLHSMATTPQGQFLDNYRQAIAGTGDRHFDTVVVPTAQQAHDLSKSAAGTVRAVMDCYYPSTAAARQLSASPRLVYRGMLTEVKRITDLVKAFQLIHQELPDSRLCLQGYFTAGYRQQVQDLINQYQLGSAVEFVKYSVGDSLYDDADLFLNASENEGLGMNMVEAMSHGVPVVSYGVRYAQPALLKDGVNSRCAANGNPAALAKQALAVLTKPDQYQQLSQGALATARQFNQKDYTHQWQEVLKKN